MGNISHLIEHYKSFIQLLQPCMDDYLYVLDCVNDIYYMSEGALERFPVPATEFSDVTNNLKLFVYAEDFPLLEADIREIVEGRKNDHNIQYRWIDKEGNPVWINCRGIAIRDELGRCQYLVGCVNEIGEKQKADNVSGLLGEFSLQQEWKQIQKQNLQGFILRMGIDKFKEINEEKGAEYGDYILRQTAECIKRVILPDQLLFRVVADEFAVLDISGRDIEEAKQIYEQTRIKINKFIKETGYEVFYTLSGGILDFTDVEQMEFKNLMKLSEFSLNCAKDAGRNQFYVYQREDYAKFQQRKDLTQIIRRSIMNDFEGFDVYFQPIMDVRTGKLVSAEALLRFRTRERGMIPPLEVVPILEESGLIIPVGRWVLYRSMEVCSKIQEFIPEFKVSVNLSYVQVAKSDILSEIVAGVRQYGLHPGSVTMELTESGFFEMQTASFIQFCDGLKDYGVSMALDDFGTGYSNFNYLYELSPDTIKVDRSMTVKALKNEHEYRLLQHLIDMSHSVNSKFCVEGIETKEDLEKISLIQPDFIQGYYFGKPCPYEEFVENFVYGEQPRPA